MKPERKAVYEYRPGGIVSSELTPEVVQLVSVRGRDQVLVLGVVAVPEMMITAHRG